MLVSCKGLQAKYIIRGLQGKMRIGLSVSTVMGEAFLSAFLRPPFVMGAFYSACAIRLFLSFNRLFPDLNGVGFPRNQLAFPPRPPPSWVSHLWFRWPVLLHGALMHATNANSK